MTDNQSISMKWSWIEATHRLRTQTLECLHDTDLIFSPGGQNLPLGELCRRMGDVQHSYTQSFHTFTLKWLRRDFDPDVSRSVALLKAGFDTLDTEMKSTVGALSGDGADRTIDRGGFPAPVEFQLENYLQSVLIFLGQAGIYLKALNRALPQFFEEYIG